MSESTDLLTKGQEVHAVPITPAANGFVVRGHRGMLHPDELLIATTEDEAGRMAADMLKGRGTEGGAG